MRRILTTAAVLALLASPASTQQLQPRQQPACGPVDTLVTVLRDQFGELEAGYGLDTASGFTARLYLKPDGSTWTILLVTPRGIACVALFGTAWSPVVRAPGEPS